MNEENKATEVKVNEIKPPEVPRKSQVKAGVETKVLSSSPALRIAHLERSNEAKKERIAKIKKEIILNNKKIKAEKVLQALDETVS